MVPVFVQDLPQKVPLIVLLWLWLFLLLSRYVALGVVCFWTMSSSSFVPNIPCTMFLPISLHGISVSSFSFFSKLVLHPSSLCVFTVLVWCPWLLFGLVVSFLVWFLVSILSGLGTSSCSTGPIIPLFNVSTFLISVLSILLVSPVVMGNPLGLSSQLYARLFPLLRCRFLL